MGNSFRRNNLCFLDLPIFGRRGFQSPMLAWHRLHQRGLSVFPLCPGLQEWFKYEVCSPFVLIIPLIPLSPPLSSISHPLSYSQPSFCTVSSMLSMSSVGLPLLYASSLTLSMLECFGLVTAARDSGPLLDFISYFDPDDDDAVERTIDNSKFSSLH